jgi:hypothetical protein
VNNLPKDRITRMLGATTALAGALLLAAIVIPADPLGRLIGALIAASVAVGLAGIALPRAAFPSGSVRRGPHSDPLPQGDPIGPIARIATDTTAWGFEDRTPDFAPVISLTEARVARRRTEPERREVTTA